MIGFGGEAIVFALMAIFQQQFKGLPVLFVLMYALTFFFDDFGPNTTTFVIPAEIYPTDVRATCHGISAAFGKAGAAVGASLFLKISYAFCAGGECTKASPTRQLDQGIRVVFICCAVLATVGLLWTWALVDDTPHDSLALVEAIYGVEPEQPGEVAALEMLVQKAHAKEAALAEEGKSKEQAEPSSQ